MNRAISYVLLRIVAKIKKRFQLKSARNDIQSKFITNTHIPTMRNNIIDNIIKIIFLLEFLRRIRRTNKKNWMSSDVRL